jgi:hypothetical protein
MEIIIGIIIVLVGVALYFNRKPKVAEVAEVPYKVETPVAAPVVEEAPAPVVEAAPAKKTRAKKAAAPAKKPAARKPRAK